MVISAPGHAVIRAVITGKASHAGNRPREGIGAITTAARAVAAMKLGQVDDETTANIGTLSAVGATNVVNPRMEFIAEARSRNKEKLRAQTGHMTDCLKAACHESGAALDYGIEQLYEGFDIPEDHPFLLELSGIFRSMGISPSPLPPARQRRKRAERHGNHGREPGRGDDQGTFNRGGTGRDGSV